MAKVKGVKKVILADNEAYKGFLPGLLKFSLSLQKENLKSCINFRQHWSVFYIMHKNEFYMNVFVFLEALTPLLVAAQNQFKFSHIVAPATAFGKVD